MESKQTQVAASPIQSLVGPGGGRVKYQELTEAEYAWAAARFDFRPSPSKQTKVVWSSLACRGGHQIRLDYDASYSGELLYLTYWSMVMNRSGCIVCNRLGTERRAKRRAAKRQKQAEIDAIRPQPMAFSLTPAKASGNGVEYRELVLSQADYAQLETLADVMEMSVVDVVRAGTRLLKQSIQRQLRPSLDGSCQPGQ